MKKEYELLYKVVKNFEGMQKIDVFDMMHKLEILLFYAPSPVTRESIKNIINADIDENYDIDPFHFTLLPNGNFCNFIGSNDWIHIYKEVKKGIGKLSMFDSYYFKTKHAPLELVKLTKCNLLENFKSTAEEVDILDFLNKNHNIKKSVFIDKLLLLDLYSLENY